MRPPPRCWGRRGYAPSSWAHVRSSRSLSVTSFQSPIVSSLFAARRPGGHHVVDPSSALLGGQDDGEQVVARGRPDDAQPAAVGFAAPKLPLADFLDFGGCEAVAGDVLDVPGIPDQL